MLSTLHWLKKGETVLLSGTNMPVTALEMVRNEDKGIVHYSIGKAGQLTEQIADNSTVLA